MGGRRPTGKSGRKQSAKAAARNDQHPYPALKSPKSKPQPPPHFEDHAKYVDFDNMRSNPRRDNDGDAVSDITSYSTHSNYSYASAASVATTSSVAVNVRGGVDVPPERGYMGCAIDSDGEGGIMEYQRVKPSRKASPRSSPNNQKRARPNNSTNSPQRAQGGAPPGSSSGYLPNKPNQTQKSQQQKPVKNQQTTSTNQTARTSPQAPQTPPVHTQQQPTPQKGNRTPPRQSSNNVTSNNNVIYKLCNIPRAFCNQKDLYQELRASPSFNKLASFKFNYPDNATLYYRETPPKEALQYFRNRLGDPAVTFGPMSPRTPYPQQPPRNPTYSCVITRVPLNFSDDDVTECLLDNGIKAKKMWRIISRATNKATTLVRVVSEDRRAIDYMIANGVHMFMSHYRCEPSNAPAPRPLQCGRCYDFGHAASECRAAPICPHCGKMGCKRDCDKQAPPKCTNCKGDHPAYSYKCPQKSAPVQPKQRVAPLLPADKPAPPIPQDATVNEINENFLQVDDFIRTLSMTFLNLFPDRRAEVQTVLVAVSRMYLKKDICFNYAGHLVHIAV